MNTFSKSASGRQTQKAATRARILSVAREELEQTGFEGTGIREVARAAGVSAGTVLLHFTDKQDLLHAALFEDLQRAWARARKRPRRKSLEADLASLARAFFRYYEARPALSRTLLRESLFASPPWSERFARQAGEVHTHVAELTEEAKARGEFRKELEAGLCAATWVAHYYLALLAWAQGGQQDPARMFRKLMGHYLDGWRRKRK